MATSWNGTFARNIREMSLWRVDERAWTYLKLGGKSCCIRDGICGVCFLFFVKLCNYILIFQFVIVSCLNYLNYRYCRCLRHKKFIMFHLYRTNCALLRMARVWHPWRARADFFLPPHGVEDTGNPKSCFTVAWFCVNRYARYEPHRLLKWFIWSESIETTMICATCFWWGIQLVERIILILVPVYVRYTPYFRVSTFPQWKIGLIIAQCFYSHDSYPMCQWTLNTYEKYCTRWAHTSFNWGEI